jgi:hypothetical protein
LAPVYHFTIKIYNKIFQLTREKFWVPGSGFAMGIPGDLSIMPEADVPGHIINYQLSIVNC